MRVWGSFLGFALPLCSGISAGYPRCTGLPHCNHSLNVQSRCRHGTRMSELIKYLLCGTSNRNVKRDPNGIHRKADLIRRRISVGAPAGELTSGPSRTRRTGIWKHP